MKNKSLDQNKVPSNSVKKEQPKKEPEKKKYKTYSYALKREVVYQVVSGKMFINQARKHYDIKGKTLIYQWIKKYGLLFYNPTKNYNMSQSPNEKIKELQKKIEQLELEKDILLDIQQIYQDDFDVPVKKYLSHQLNEDLKKHIKKNQKKG